MSEEFDFSTLKKDKKKKRKFPNKQIIERQKKAKKESEKSLEKGSDKTLSKSKKTSETSVSKDSGLKTVSKLPIEEPFSDIIEVKEAPKIPTEKEVMKKQKELDPNKEEDFAIIVRDKPQDLALPSFEEVDYKIDIIKYVKQKVVSSEDYGEMFGETFLKASGYDKFISYFKLNVTYPSRDVYEDEDGWHCDVICRVEDPWSNQVVEAYGGASMKTMTIRKTRHNMKGLAETRAKTRAVRVIMGFSKPSYSEMIGTKDKTEELF